jgi:hypothetical protein
MCQLELCRLDILGMRQLQTQRGIEDAEELWGSVSLHGLINQLYPPGATLSLGH